MIKRACIMLPVLFVILVFSDLAGAELTKIGTATYNGKEYGLIYEDDQNLIWLDYYKQPEPYGIGWYGQVEWAAGLNFPGVLTYDFNPGVSINWQGSWRLPLSEEGGRVFGFDGTTTAGFNITTSEMGHLFYESLGNLGYYDMEGNTRPGWEGLKNTGPFENLLPESYWSGTEYEYSPFHAWDFNMYFGSQNNLAFSPNYMFGALAVRPAMVVRSSSR